MCTNCCNLLGRGLATFSRWGDLRMQMVEGVEVRAQKSARREREREREREKDRKKEETGENKENDTSRMKT